MRIKSSWNSSLNLAIAKTLDARADGMASRSTDPAYNMMDICIKDRRSRRLFRLAESIQNRSEHVQYLRILIYRARAFRFLWLWDARGFLVPTFFPITLSSTTWGQEYCIA
jgi:hypothetical protein